MMGQTKTVLEEYEEASEVARTKRHGQFVLGMLDKMYEISALRTQLNLLQRTELNRVRQKFKVRRKAIETDIKRFEASIVGLLGRNGYWSVKKKYVEDIKKKKQAEKAKQIEDATETPKTLNTTPDNNTTTKTPNIIKEE